MEISKQRKPTQQIIRYTLGVSLLLSSSVILAERSAPKAPLPLSELRAFTEVFEKIKTDYVEPVGDASLLEGAIRGMLSGLDPHSSYLDPDAFKELQVGTSGEFGGLGIEVGMEDGFIKIITPMDDTPAYHAGVKPGDLIIRIDDTPVKGLTLNEAVNLMRGKPGSEVTLTIVRKNADNNPLKITISRAIIQVKGVKSKMLEPGFGYIRITQFQTHTGKDLIGGLSKLQKASKEGLKGLVLDLRNNPGGILGAAVSVSDAFLTEGLIVYTEGRVKDSQLKFKATQSDLLKGAPLIVLVNDGSASASEIVAGALQDHKRALIMGKRTFGKGSVQTILPMKNGSALKLTTARYYTPAGRSIQAEGIIPDIELEDVQISKAETSSFGIIKEADLSRHLEQSKNDNDTTEAAGETPKEKEKIETTSLTETDYQLNEALNLLKGLAIFAR